MKEKLKKIYEEIQTDNENRQKKNCELCGNNTQTQDNVLTRNGEEENKKIR